MQLDDPARGFTFKTTAPLDMRLNPTRGVSAGERIARASVTELRDLLEAYAHEPYAEAVAADDRRDERASWVVDAHPELTIVLER